MGRCSELRLRRAAFYVLPSLVMDARGHVGFVSSLENRAGRICVVDTNYRRPFHVEMRSRVASASSRRYRSRPIRSKSLRDNYSLYEVRLRGIAGKRVLSLTGLGRSSTACERS